MSATNVSYGMGLVDSCSLPDEALPFTFILSKLLGCGYNEEVH